MAKAITKVSFLAGTDIEEACEAALELDRKLSVYIEFNFNGKTLDTITGCKEKMLKEYKEYIEWTRKVNSEWVKTI